MTRALKAFSAEVPGALCAPINNGRQSRPPGSAQENATNKESRARSRSRAWPILSILSAAFVLLILFAAPIIAAPAGMDNATSVTVPDDTFGEGGTRQSFSNDKHEVLAEVWRDKNNIVREQFEITDGGAQLWAFFNGTGEGQPSSWRKSMIAIRPMDRPTDRFQMWVIAADESIIKEMSTLSRAELDSEFEYWHAQLRLWVNTARRRQEGLTGCPTCPL